MNNKVKGTQKTEAPYDNKNAVVSKEVRQVVTLIFINMALAQKQEKSKVGKQNDRKK